jgi:hypothetical protein
MTHHRLTKGLAARALAACLALVVWAGIVVAAEPELSKTSGGLTVYLGVIPAEIVKGLPLHAAEKPMHGRIPRGPHEFHVVAALFDAASGTRVSDAVVTAQVSGLGLAGSKKKLEPMRIEGTTTYGAFFTLPGRDLYTVKLSVERPGAARPVTFEFKYDHR